MIRRLSLLAVVLLSVFCVYGQQASPNIRLTAARPNVAFSFPAISAVGYSGYIDLTHEDLLSFHTVEAEVNGTVSACTYQVLGADDPSSANWYDLGGVQSCTSSAMFHVPDKPVPYFQVHVVTFTGTGSVTFFHSAGK